MSQVCYGKGYVYSIQYHLVWRAKYRHKILFGNAEKRLKELLYKVVKENKITIVTMETDKDHIHLLMECTPQSYIPSVMKALKGITARQLLKEFPELKKKLWGGHLWNPSYFVATVSENAEEQIIDYIKGQKTK